jgi:hypothetical protein
VILGPTRRRYRSKSKNRGLRQSTDFKIGQAVYFHPKKSRLALQAPVGPYLLTKRFLAAEGEFDYAIRSPHEDHERVAREEASYRDPKIALRYCDAGLIFETWQRILRGEVPVRARTAASRLPSLIASERLALRCGEVAQKWRVVLLKFPIRTTFRSWAQMLRTPSRSTRGS